jgi:gliding motility-associated-like protein
VNGLPATGEWTLILYPGGALYNGTGTTTTVTSLTAGTYNFAVTNDQGCTSVASSNAVINPQPPTPTAPVVGTITHPTLTVLTGSVVLSGLPSSGTWTLTRQPDNVLLSGTGTTRTITGINPGTYTFTVMNSFGCTSLPSANVVINAIPGAPVLVINNPATVCSPETVDLTATAITEGSDEGLTFTYWSDADATIPYSTPETATEGTWYIMGTTTAGYSTIKPVVVTVDQRPVADAGPDQVLEYVFQATLNAVPVAGAAGVWTIETGTGIFGNETDPGTTVTDLSLGTNEFTWTITFGVCPPISDVVTIIVNDLVVPTLITPNIDGRNDYFVLRGLETLGKTELIIFDRRGAQVYMNSDYDNSWDGVDKNGKPLPDDTYFFVIRSANGKTINGYIVIRR